MSRPKVALPLPSPPTAPQVMMGEVAYGICLSKNLHEYGGRCKWAGSLPPPETCTEKHGTQQNDRRLRWRVGPLPQKQPLPTLLQKKTSPGTPLSYEENRAPYSHLRLYTDIFGSMTRLDP